MSVTVMAAALGAGMAHAAASEPATTPAATKAVQKTERVMSDSWITTKVKSEILANSVTKAFKVSVKTLHGTVALKGKLPNQDAIDQVKQIAEKVKGVKSVDTSALTVAAS
jgi:hyperosmotically inducible protein